MPEPEGRIAELEGRVERDPASPAFAALAEEYRKAGRLEEAVTTCRRGLEHLPGYITARVTLARTLSSLGEFAEALQHLQDVLEDSPDNLAARQTLYEVRRRMSGLEEDASDPDGDRPELPAPASRGEGLPPPLDVSSNAREPSVEAQGSTELSAGETPLAPERDPRVLQGLENLLNAIMKARIGPRGQDRS